MSFDAGSVTSTLGIDVSPFAKGMLQAETISKLFPAVVTEFLANPLLAVVGIFEKTAHAAEGFFHVVARQAEQMNAIGEAAQKAGVSVEFLSGVGKAFENAGSSVDGLAESMKFLNKTTGEVISGMQGSERAADIFHRLGISTEFLRQHANDSEGVFYAVADAVSKIGSTSERTDVLMELLSRSGSDAGNAFSLGSKGLKQFAEDINKLGDITTAKDAELGHSFALLQSYFHSAIDGMEKAAARPILEALQNHFGDAKTGVIEFANALDGRVSSAVQGAVNFFTDHSGEIKDDIRQIGILIDGWLPSLAEVLKLSTEAVNRLVDFSDLIGVTNPNQRFGMPYASGPQTSFDALDSTKVAAQGDKGLADLAKIAEGFKHAGDAVNSALASVASGSLELHAIQGGGFTDADARKSAEQQGQSLRSHAIQMREALDAIQSMRDSGKVDPTALAAAVESLQKFGKALDDSGGLIKQWQNFSETAGWKENAAALKGVSDQFNSSLAVSRSAMQDVLASVVPPSTRDSNLGLALGPIGQLLQSFSKGESPILDQKNYMADLLGHYQKSSSPVMANWNAGSAPGAENAIPSASLGAASISGGAGSLSNALGPAAALLDVFSSKASGVNDELQVLGDSLGQLNPQFAALIASANAAPASAPAATQPSSSNSSLGGVTINTLNVPSLDPIETGNQIGNKIAPLIRAQADQAARAAAATAQSIRSRAGL